MLIYKKDFNINKSYFEKRVVGKGLYSDKYSNLKIDLKRVLLYKKSQVALKWQLGFIC